MHFLSGENGIVYNYTAGDLFLTVHDPDNLDCCNDVSLAISDLVKANIMVEEQCRKSTGDLLKVFISQPYTGIPEADVMKKKEEIMKKTMEIIRLDEQFDEYPDDKIWFFDQYHQPYGPTGCTGIYYLGNSIKMMDEADIVVFSDDFGNAKGCIVESIIATLYKNNFRKIIYLGEGDKPWISSLISQMK